MTLRDRLRSWFGIKSSSQDFSYVDQILAQRTRMAAGVPVNNDTALQVSTVLACARCIADGCATPKLHVYREGAGGRRELASNIPEYRLLSRRPNEWQTSVEWRRMMTMHAVLTGTGLSLKVRGDNRRVRELIPIMPGRWDVQRVNRYELRYRIWDEWGPVVEATPADVFIVQNVAWDWVRALDAVGQAAQSIGLAIATERTHSERHANGVQTSGTYSVDGALSSEQHQRLLDVLKRYSVSGDRSGAPLVLDRGAKYLQTTMSGVDAQHLETRRHQIEEICRAFGVFPLMVGHADKTATFASSEAFFAAHLKHTLAPWHAAWTQRIDEFLLDGSGPLWAEFDSRYLLAGSMADRAQWARAMVELGVYTRNEVRDEEGKDPLPGLDEPLTPLNVSGTADEPPADDEADPAVRAVRALGARLDVLAARPASQPIVLHTAEIEREMRGAITRLNAEFAAQIAEIKESMPINITLPEQPAPVVTVSVDAPVVNVEAPNVTVAAPDVTVIDTHPKRAITTVERDATDGIKKTVTTYE